MVLMRLAAHKLLYWLLATVEGYEALLSRDLHSAHVTSALVDEWVTKVCEIVLGINHSHSIINNT